MPTSKWDATLAWRELLEGLSGLDDVFLNGPRAVPDERSVAEGYRMLVTALGVALDGYLFGDPARPIFVDVNAPQRRDRAWGGDNTDAYYCFTPIDPARHYRVSGRAGDSAYWSLTVYNEPGPGQWSDRVVGIVNDTDVAVDADGRFSFLLGPERPADHDGAFIELAPDAAFAFTRDYQFDPRTGARVVWEIEALDPPPSIIRTDADTARAFRTALEWVRTLFAVVPTAITRRADESLGHHTPTGVNEFAEPYQVPDANYGWSARDACYSFATFALEADEALVVTHRPPSCRFWNLVVWNPFMATEALTDARTSINIGAAVPDADGTVTVVIARELGSHPNAVSTAGLAEGMLAFRWFLTDDVPERPTVELVRRADAPLVVC